MWAEHDSMTFVGFDDGEKAHLFYVRYFFLANCLLSGVLHARARLCVHKGALSTHHRTREFLSRCEIRGQRGCSWWDRVTKLAQNYMNTLSVVQSELFVEPSCRTGGTNHDHSLKCHPTHSVRTGLQCRQPHPGSRWYAERIKAPWPTQSRKSVGKMMMMMILGWRTLYITFWLPTATLSCFYLSAVSKLMCRSCN